MKTNFTPTFTCWRFWSFLTFKFEWSSEVYIQLFNCSWQITLYKHHRAKTFWYHNSFTKISMKMITIDTNTLPNITHFWIVASDMARVFICNIKRFASRFAVCLIILLHLYNHCVPTSIKANQYTNMCVCVVAHPKIMTKGKCFH